MKTGFMRPASTQAALSKLFREVRLLHSIKTATAVHYNFHFIHELMWEKLQQAV
jgi:hypothetical protein